MNDHLAIAYSWSFGNIGDIGITTGLLNQVQRRAPGQPVKVLAPRSKDGTTFTLAKEHYEARHGNCEVVPSDFTLTNGCRSAWSSFVARWGQHTVDSFVKGCVGAAEAERMAEDLLHTYADEVIGTLTTADDPGLAAILGARFLVYNSGMTLNFGHLQQRSLGRTLHNLMPLVIARRLGVPYGINAQSFEAVDWPLDLVQRPIHEDAAFVFCRDSDSVDYLRQRRLGRSDTTFKPDTMVFFADRDEAWADRFLADHGLRTDDYLAVIIRVAAEQPVASDMAGGSISAGRREAHLTKVRHLIHQWIEQTGRPVLICHELRRSVASTRTLLWDTLDPAVRKHCSYLDEFWLPEQSCAVLSRARALVSMEAHSVMMALGNGVPAVHIPFAEAGRKRFMMHDYGLPDWLVDIDDCSPEHLVETVLGIDRDHPDARERAGALRARMQRETDSVLDRVLAEWPDDWNPADIGAGQSQSPSAGRVGT